MRQTSSSYSYAPLYDPGRRQLQSHHRIYLLGSLLGGLIGLALLFWRPVTAAPGVAQPPPTPTATATMLSMIQVGNSANPIRRYYHDPDGLYSIPVPQSWRSERHHDYLELTSPQEQIQIYILTISGTDVKKAIDQAWRRVDPTFAMPAKHTLEMPSLNDLEEIQTVTYDDGITSGELVLALGQQHDDIVYVVLTRGQLAAFEERAAQIRLIQSGFTLYSLSRSSLRGVEPQPVNADLLAKLERYIKEVLDRYQIPGASVVVVQGNQIVYRQGFGVRKLGSTEPVLPSTQMMIGSVGKTMTTMMMASMVDDRLFTWDTPVVDVLPTFRIADPALSQRLTMRNLVCSCTGVPRRDFELFFQGGNESAEDVIASLQHYKLLTKVGETFQYSNQMVATGGYIAAAASGGHYGRLYDQYVAQMAQRVFKPIGMNKTTFSFDAVMTGANYAQPHSVNLAMQLTPLPLALEAVVTPVAPAGGAWSNAEDLGRYLITLLNSGIAPDGTQVVSPWNLGVTWQPQVPVSANTSYGLGWFVDNYKGLRLLNHGGNTLGFTSDLAFLPEANVGIAVLTNAQGVNFVTEAIRYRFLELLYNQEQRYDDYAHYRYEILRQYLGDSANQLGIVDSRAVMPYLGSYHNEELGTMQLVQTGDRLQLVVNRLSVELRPQADDHNDHERYVIYSPPLAGIPVQLTRSETGQPVVVLGAGVAQYTFTRHSLPLVNSHVVTVGHYP